MNFWMLAVNVAVGSVIGGVTNELAIRMLFRPHRPWRIGGWQVPFTPGLIPRRRDDIAVQMGRLVEEHLLTTEGIKKALAHGEMEQKLTLWMARSAEEWLSDSRTLRHWLTVVKPSFFQEGEERLGEEIREPLRQAWERWVAGQLDLYRDRPLLELLPASGRERIDEAMAEVSRLFLGKAREYVRSQEGVETLQQMVRGLVGGGGGMFGGLVGMFLGDDKIIGKLLPHLDELLRNPALAGKIHQVLSSEADKLLHKTVGEVVEWMGSEQVESWARAIFAKLEQEALRLADKPVSELLAPFRQTIVTELIPKAARWMVEKLETNIDALFEKLPIREIVTRQVESFPIERIEEMVVGISGREFRMITILGFILGGVIGLVQGVLALLFT
ncbi:DUF445 family protein [Brevibacillus composti]|uniref:DUF445 family protein n=1 Tax=Brevibacillus composti TaxID=2796470 RepID=A0A7T5EJ19_9BACL|nr:DUF445 family protein [Brevibacillus composti]QQE73551.1 DUF445 family protein [Brevibacillus composti]QUO40633.1 DUF445 family protein [Brevibacillus composti]